MFTADRNRRFDAKWMPEPNSGCWLWFGGANEHGYGVFWNGVRLEKAHRFSLLRSGLYFDADEVIRHHCDTPACVNPAHLTIGTTQDNVDDMWLRNRATTQRRHGEAQSQAKLSDATVAMIRESYARGRLKQRELAAKYGVSQRAIWNVVSGTGWAKTSGVEVIKGCGR